MNKIKVCILQNGLSYGGTDTFVLNLCRGMNKDKYDITVVCPERRPEKMGRVQDLIDTGVTLLQTSPLNSLKSKMIHFVRLYKILRKGRYDVFQTNIDLFNGPQMLISWLAGVPVRCCHSHNTMQQRSLKLGTTLTIRIYQSLMKWMCWTFSNRRSACSEDAMNFLFARRNWHQENYPVVINNGIDIDRFRQPIDVDAKKKELGLTAKYNIVTVGHIIPQKNPLFIADAFSELCKIREDVELVWVGVGELKEQCEDILRKNGCLEHVHFLGSRTDVNEILPCCDLFFMPSAFEGLGIVIIEAQAAGLSCLVSDVVPKETNCGGVNYMSLNKDLKDWAEAMSQMIDGKIQLKIVEDKIQEFSVNHMVEQMEQVFMK